MIDQMLDSNEQILWRGKPNRTLYTIGSPAFYIFAFIWALIDVSIFGAMILGGMHKEGGVFFILMCLFFMLHMTPVWIAILAPIYRFFSWKAIDYVVTTKRVYMQSGLIGSDITSLEYPEIGNLTVDVGVLEKLKGVGTVQLTPDVSTGSGKRRRTHKGSRLKHIQDPYAVYKMIKQISLDVSTDYQYPNAYRPNANTGYQTQYQGQYQMPAQNREIRQDVSNAPYDNR